MVKYKGSLNLGLVPVPQGTLIKEEKRMRFTKRQMKAISLAFQVMVAIGGKNPMIRSFSEGAKGSIAIQGIQDFPYGSVLIFVDFDPEIIEPCKIQAQIFKTGDNGMKWKKFKVSLNDNEQFVLEEIKNNNEEGDD